MKDKMNKRRTSGLLLGLMSGLLLLALPAIFSEKAIAQDAPLFPDKALEAIVRKYVFEKRTNDMPLVEADVQNISTIEGKFREGQKVSNLAGLEKCRSLALLDLEGHEIQDLAPIKDLKGLQSVNLAGNKIADITPLGDLTGLQYLQLSGNQISDLAPLAKLTALRSLYLAENKIKDLEPLAGLTKLWSLYLNGNQISDLKPLTELTGIDALDLRNNAISDLKPLAGFTELKYLMLDKNKISDIGVLVEMSKRDTEGDVRFAPFLRVYLTENPLSDDARKVQVPELKKLIRDVTLE